MSRNKTVKASRLKQAKAPSPIEPARFDDFVVTSLQALADGNATAHEQKKALEWIINEASIANGLPYQPDSPRNTDFALGRAFVGQQIIGILKIPMINFAPSETPPERDNNVTPKE